ncbi:hypothetical protein AB3X91_06715 [Paraburkholderia sp. BR14263]|uniref:hypothetical protein n=1 Tax=unclassified Paraburkholderia TaxID=2615204 RepID=UPI0034CE81AB
MNHDEALNRATADARTIDEAPEFARFSAWLRGRGTAVASDARATGLTGAWTRRLVKFSALWALVELPVAYWSAADDLERAALAASTVIWLAIVVRVLKGGVTARGVFVFLCALSLLAVAPALPAEYANFRIAFWLSLVECAVKCGLFVVFVSRYIAMEP